MAADAELSSPIRSRNLSISLGRYTRRSDALASVDDDTIGHQPPPETAPPRGPRPAGPACVRATTRARGSTGLARPARVTPGCGRHWSKRRWRPAPALTGAPSAPAIDASCRIEGTRKPWWRWRAPSWRPPIVCWHARPPIRSRGGTTTSDAMPSTFGDVPSRPSSGKGIASRSNLPTEREVESTGEFLSKATAVFAKESA